MDPFHVVLARLVKRAYDPLFITDPQAVAIDDLGLIPVDILFGTDPGGDTVPYGIIARCDKGMVIGLCGTRTGVEWLADGLAVLVPCPWGTGWAHSGILGIFNTLRTSKGIPVAQAMIGCGPVHVAGHSLGAALASMLARRLAADTLVSLAGPRDGDSAFAAYGVVRIGTIARYVIPGDVVPELPPPLPLPFRHLCDPIVLPRPAIKDTVECRHSIDTYLNAMDSTLPLNPACTA